MGLGAAAIALGTGFARADPPTLRLGLQESGTARWEIAAMKALGFPAKYGFALEERPLADSPAGQVALKSGAVDIILSDFVWVSVERYRGSDATLVPFSLAVGGLLAGDGGPTTIRDLKGATIGVGGGPLDKSWLFLQALYKQETGGSLHEDAQIRFGAAPLINTLLLRGELGAALNFWQWNTRAKLAGARAVISVAEMLGKLGISSPPPLLGWTFSERAAAERPELFDAFFAASRETKQHLLNDDALWAETVRPLMDASDDRLFIALRDGYREGIPRASGNDAAPTAAAAYAVLAQVGGADLVQGATTLSPGTFWEGLFQ